MIKKIIKILLFPIFFFIYLLSGIIKRNENLWAFGSFTDNFDENTKYLFLYKEHISIENLKFIWIFKKRKNYLFYKNKINNAVYLYSFKGIYFAVKAKYYIVNAYVSDISFWLSNNAIVINLWHGIPIKKIEYDITSGILRRQYHPVSYVEKIDRLISVPFKIRKPDLLLSTSPKVSKIFSKAFNIDINNIIIDKYPRTYIFNSKKNEIEKIINRFENDEVINVFSVFNLYSQIYLYLPTWRDNNNDFVNIAIPSFDELENLCQKKNILFLIKAHNNTNTLNLQKKYNNIRFLSKSVDIYPFFKYIDLLITDYSSVLFDYALLNKPILFYIFDFNEYLKNREFYYNLKDVLYGSIAKSFDDLIKVIETGQININQVKRNNILSNIIPANMKEGSMDSLIYNIKSIK